MFHFLSILYSFGNNFLLTTNRQSNYKRTSAESKESIEDVESQKIDQKPWINVD